MPRDATLADRLRLYNDNAFKIGMFGANCSSGRFVTKVPERWSGSWEDNVRLAEIADAAGIDFLLPIGRWKGYGGETDYQGATWETVTWAAGLLAKTRRITVFGTVHAPLLNPVIAAKEFVTADHIGEGRFGLNVVCGWNEGEFEMFGVDQREHEASYDYAEEWLGSIKMMWSSAEPFDFDGRYVKLKDVRAKPKPYGGTRPLVMNAGTSPRGRAFALKHCDALFISARPHALFDTAAVVRDLRAAAAAEGNAIDIYTVGVAVCRPTTPEAEEYHRHCTQTEADWGGVDGILALKGIFPGTTEPAEYQRIRTTYANGLSGFPLVGDPDHVAGELAKLAAAGFRGIGISFVNYAAELPYFCDEVLPRLKRLGLRA